jgi:hypothetical protein
VGQRKNRRDLARSHEVVQEAIDRHCFDIAVRDQGHVRPGT